MRLRALRCISRRTYSILAWYVGKFKSIYVFTQLYSVATSADNYMRMRVRKAKAVAFKSVKERIQSLCACAFMWVCKRKNRVSEQHLWICVSDWILRALNRKLEREQGRENGKDDLPRSLNGTRQSELSNDYVFFDFCFYLKYFSFRFYYLVLCKFRQNRPQLLVSSLV